ncbi:odorant receptor 59a-like [Zeugodacus cucurbitae]|uniref:odorant receptor 59a-like n=1 Tax=Zeugodacus cucurbitae TaxID=28588 RepID=UPI0023D95534|nr:odorant receptor 59a-like [Zeugodacus cucurbitae]
MSATETPISGVTVFHFHDVTWRYVGQKPPTEKLHRYLYYIYSLLLNVIITIGYPTHLMIGLIQSESKSDMFKNMSISFTCLACSIKTFAFWWRLAEVQKIYAIITKLDKHIAHSDDYRLYKTIVLRRAQRVLYFILFIALGAAFSSEVATIIGGLLVEWRLMYPAYFPFDVERSVWGYAVAHSYQCIGVTVQIFQNLINDTFPPLALAMLAGQVRLLNLRVARVGHVASDASVRRQPSNSEFLLCVEDYKDLLEFRIAIQRICSIGTFVQILVTAINMGVVIVYLIFYVDGIFAYIYYIVFLIAMPLEIFPLCYYGTSVQMEFEQLTYAIFSCNWVFENATFKQDLRIFTEQSLRKQIVIAGGMFAVNLDTFFATLKGAYSLFAVVVQMK